MDLSNAGLIIALVVIVVILLNVGMYLAFSSRDGKPGTIELLMKAGKRAKNPWMNEDNSLKELSEIVEKLKSDGYSSSGDSEDSSNETSQRSESTSGKD